MRRAVAHWMRKWADRIDRAHAPKSTSYTFRFVDGVGIIWELGGPGCPVWYLSDEDYAKAWAPVAHSVHGELWRWENPGRPFGK